jgi:flavorubredoxin
MKAFKIKEEIYWVGAIDWHPPKLGHALLKGTTYNSYLILDKKIALIDVVKHGFTHEILSRLKDVIDPLDIDYIVIGNSQMDHTGSLPFLMKEAKNAIIVTTESSKRAIEKYHGAKWKFEIVKEGDLLNLGKRELSFSEITLGADNILVTYSVFDNILFSEDLFSQHIASCTRFDLETVGVEEEALSFFVNYLMPLKDLSNLTKYSIEFLAPNHGCIWKSMIKKIINSYDNWMKGYSKNKISVLYSTTWRGTEKMAYSIADGISFNGTEVKVINLEDQDVGAIVTQIFDSKTVVIGCSSSKENIPLELSKFFAYCKFINLKNKPTALFTCYRGKKSPVKDLLDNISAINLTLIEDPLEVQYTPDKDELKKCFDYGIIISESTKRLEY